VGLAPTAVERAVALTPGSSIIPHLTLLGSQAQASTRTAGESTLPAYASSGCVSGNDYLDFSLTSSQYIDGGERTFNMGTTGFTMMAVVMFSGTAAAGSYETFFDLGSGDIDNNINSFWDSASTGAFSGILNSNVGACNAV